MNWCPWSAGCSRLCHKHNSPWSSFTEAVCLTLTVSPPPPPLPVCLSAPKVVFLLRGAQTRCANKPRRLAGWACAGSSSSPEDFTHLRLWFLFQPPLIRESFTMWSWTWSLTFNWIQIRSARAREAVGGRLSETLGRRSGCSAAWSSL